MLGHIGAAWGVAGVAALLAQAVYRLCIHARLALASDLSPLQWTFTAVWVVLMVYAEGWRGFHRRFSPRVVARAAHLARHARPVDVLLAPLFCMSLYAASRRGMRVARSLLGGIIMLVLLVRLLPAPWRGIIDAGVVAGISVGLLSLVWFTARALLGKPAPIDADVADARSSAHP